MQRRSFLAGATALAGSLASPWVGDASAQPPSGEYPFDPNMVRRIARELAQAPFKKPDQSLTREWRDLGYDAYRAIRFKPAMALWRETDLPFQAQFFHRGSIFLDRVDLYEVDGGLAKPIVYSPTMFEFGALTPPTDAMKMGFAGFRLHAKINKADYYDEVGVFHGASYFRAVAKNQAYGLSARGLAIKTANTAGEEFPAFRTFWIERPRRNTNSIVVHAVLDSPSAAAAFRFTIRPGETTIFDTEVALYPRSDLTEAGIAPITSMFLFDSNDRVGVDDFRPAVHDSDGLAVLNGRDEELWRPLVNPRDLQVSSFADANPRGFGLLQRERSFDAYQDLESNFEKRPSLWVEPIGDWGDGAVQLVEIPTKEEIHDNIVSFWRPREPLKAKGEYVLNYRLHWGDQRPNRRELARVVKTRVGAGPDKGRRFVLDVAGASIASGDVNSYRAKVDADKGELRNLVVQRNTVSGGIRISFELLPKDEPVVELRGALLRGEDQVSETWLYRWTL